MQYSNPDQDVNPVMAPAQKPLQLAQQLTQPSAAVPQAMQGFGQLVGMYDKFKKVQSQQQPNPVDTTQLPTGVAQNLQIPGVTPSVSPQDYAAALQNRSVFPSQNQSFPGQISSAAIGQ